MHWPIGAVEWARTAFHARSNLGLRRWRCYATRALVALKARLNPRNPAPRRRTR